MIFLFPIHNIAVPEFDIIAPYYNSKEPFVQTSLERTKAALALVTSKGWHGNSVLDVGCGTGVGTIWLAQKGFSVIGIDRSPIMIELAINRANNHPNINFSQQDMRSINLSGPKFDLVISLWDVFNYLRSEQEINHFLSGVSSVLKPSGMLVFDMLTLEGIRSLLRSPLTVLSDEKSVLVNFASPHTKNSIKISFHSFQVSKTNLNYENETHFLYSYPRKKLITLLKNHKLNTIDILDGETLEPSFRESWHIFIIGALQP